MLQLLSDRLPLECSTFEQPGPVGLALHCTGLLASLIRLSARFLTPQLMEGGVERTNCAACCPGICEVGQGSSGDPVLINKN